MRIQRPFEVLQQGAVCSEWRALYQHCNAAAEAHRSAQRVDLSAPMDGVAPLAKDSAITCEVRLAMNADKPTVSVIITLKEH